MRISSYPWKLLPALALAIEHGLRENAHSDLDTLLRIIAESSDDDLTLQKLRCAELASVCLRGAHSGGAASDALLEENFRLLKLLTRLRAWNHVKQCMHQYVERLLRLLKPDYRSHMEQMVAQVRNEMRTPTGMMRSLAQHAERFGVSEGHLSRSFSAIVGRTFREELLRVRLDIACRLLQETSLKISGIAEQIGLRDPSQFIATFRTEMGLTPAKYRQMHLALSKRRGTFRLSGARQPQHESEVWLKKMRQRLGRSLTAPQ